MAMLCLRVAPADDEGLDARRKLQLHHRFLRGQIVDIGLVDLRRHCELRDGVYLLGRRRILDQLHHLGAPNHLTRRDCQILADLERALVDLADDAVIVDDVGIGVFQPLHQAEPARIDGAFDRRGIAGERVGWRQRVEDHARDEAGAVALHFVEFEIVDPRLRRLLHRQIILHPGAVEGVVAPCCVGEAFVLGCGSQVRLAGHDFHHVLAESGHMLGGLVGLHRGFAQQRADRAYHILARQPDQRA